MGRGGRKGREKGVQGEKEGDGMNREGEERTI
jgi:hypothetical protein